jgi:hypothetical protein
MILTNMLAFIFLLVASDIMFDLLRGASLSELSADFIIGGGILAIVFYTVNFVWKRFALEITQLKNSNFPSFRLFRA